MALSIFSDEHYMRQAYNEAVQAFEEDEVPIGAIVVCNNQIIGRGHNMVERLQDATAHAEMIAITAAGENLGSKILTDCTLYVTIEPCPMCAGASWWARVPKIVYGAPEPKHGYSQFSPSLTHPKTDVVGGVMEEECRELMIEFFRQKRKQ